MLKYYRCNVCGNLVEVINDSGVTPICCGKAMTQLIPQTSDYAGEKHVPVIAECKENREADSDATFGRTVTIQVGEQPHPMAEDHSILWITLLTTAGIYRKALTGCEKAEVEFLLNENEKIIAVYSYCNLHGLWVKFLK